MKLPKPNVKIPTGNTHELENAIRREFAVVRRYPGACTWDESKARDIAYSNMDELLDHYPLGELRNIYADLGEIALSEAGLQAAA